MERNLVCCDCGRLVRDEDVTLVNNINNDLIPVCPDCLDKNYYRCHDCGEWHPDHDTCKFTAHHHGKEVTVCFICIECCYSRCRICDEWYRNDDYNEDGKPLDEDFVCEHCREDSDE